jgi:hypothetical protein
VSAGGCCCAWWPFDVLLYCTAHCRSCTHPALRTGSGAKNASWRMEPTPPATCRRPLLTLRSRRVSSRPRFRKNGWWTARAQVSGRGCWSSLALRGSATAPADASRLGDESTTAVQVGQRGGSGVSDVGCRPLDLLASVAASALQVDGDGQSASEGGSRVANDGLGGARVTIAAAVQEETRGTAWDDDFDDGSGSPIATLPDAEARCLFRASPPCD